MGHSRVRCPTICHVMRIGIDAAITSLHVHARIVLLCAATATAVAAQKLWMAKMVKAVVGAARLQRIAAQWLR